MKVNFAQMSHAVYVSWITSPEQYSILCSTTLQWRHNEVAGVSNHQPHDCLLNRLFRRRSKKTLKLRVTGLCVGNSPATGEFPAQRASNAENVSIWWRHHDRHSLDNLLHVYIHSMDIDRYQASAWTNYDLLSIGPMGKHFRKMHKMQLKVSAKCLLFCLGLSVLTHQCVNWSRPSNAYIFTNELIKPSHHQVRSWLVASSVPSDYLNLCWWVANWILRNKLRRNSDTSFKNAFQMSSARWQPFSSTSMC